jgi:hypothetical protein
MPRRLFAAAAAGALALVALSGCRIESASDAAYVGDTSYSQADVSKVVDGMKADHATISDAQLAPLDQDIVARSVFLAVAKRYAAEHDYAIPAVNADSVAQAVSLPASDPYVRLAAEAQAYQTLLLNKVTPARLGAGDYHDTFSLLLRQQAVDPGTETEVTQELQQKFADPLARAVGLRNELTAAMKRYDTSINPRYLPAGFPLMSVQTSSGGSVNVVELVMGGAGQAPVRDITPVLAPTPTPSDQSNQ